MGVVRMVDVVRAAAALGNEKRYAILKILCRGSFQSCCHRLEIWENGACVSDVVSMFKLSQSTVSHHLAILEAAGLVERETRGLYTCYFPNRETVLALIGALQADLLSGGPAASPDDGSAG
ncbi:MAG: ArsR/SmtB family transcription factor [Bacteroidota bacterium]